ncbi:MAG: hypothetical protein ACK4UO_18975 [Pseudolabrys sp.]
MAVLLFAAAVVTPALAELPPPQFAPVQIAAAEATSVEAIFTEFGLFGVWAGDCAKKAAPDNPHVHIARASTGVVFEEHDLGPGYAVNVYNIVSAERLSSTRVSTRVIFQPGGPKEERQTLVFDLRGNTRRTMFNQAEGGPVRVKDGVAVALGNKTPVLKKCDQP